MKKTMLMMASVMMLAACGQKQTMKVPAIDLANLDTTVTPGQDFYRFSTGGWQKNHPLGAEYARFGSFDQLRETNVERLNDLFAKMTTMKTEPGSTDSKIVTLYKQGLDSLKLNADGAAPLKEDLAAVYAPQTKEELIRLVAQLHNAGVGPFFGAYVMADLMDSDAQILYMGQGGLGIGDRDYYIEEANAAIKEGYRAFLEKVLGLAGVPEPAAAAGNALAVEQELALQSWDSVRERDYSQLYNPRTTAQLLSELPGLHLDTYFAERGIPDQEKLILCEPSFFESLSALFEKTDLQVLKDYVAGQLVQDACGALSDDFYEASFAFFSRQMSGIQEQKPRWKRAMQVPNGILGQAVGKMYVERYFPESSKQKMVTLVENLRTALSQHIDALDWMSDETKVKAHEKLDHFTVKIGYPDQWKDYSTLEVDPAKTYYANLRAANRWYVADNMSKLGQPTDKTEWGMTPQTVNAYYNPSTNEICFPAAILQPPFFNPDADDAVNYGGIGVVIGHEMSHGFDDQGRLFDAYGNMNSWWTKADDEKFRAKAEVLAAQFDAVEILPGLKANGHLTLGENIGDHGGLSIAYTAMENALAGQEVAPIDGYTPAQRFWLSYGAIWAQNSTDEEKARLTKLDVHSLAENRVNVSVRNFDQFFRDWGITEGEPMWRPEEERVHIW